MLAASDIARFIDTIADPTSGAPTGSSAALAGAMAASMLAGVCAEGIDHCRSEKAEDDLRAMRDRAAMLRRDLSALVEQGARASKAVAGARDDRDRLLALLFASEVPLRIAESCHALMGLALQALGRTGVRSIAGIGTGAALAFAGVVGGVVTARGYLAGIPQGSGIGASSARRRAENIFRDAEALRAQVLDRVRAHLPKAGQG